LADRPIRIGVQLSFRPPKGAEHGILQIKFPDCESVYFWTVFKTGSGKAPEQIVEMKRKEIVCRDCGSVRLKTGLDHETEYGQAQDEVCNFAAHIIKNLVEEKTK